MLLLALCGVAWTAVEADAAVDLVSSVTALPSSASAGSSISITYKVQNMGSSSAGSSGLKLYLSSNTTLDGSDYYLSPTVSIPSLSGGSAVSASVNKTLPSVSSGTWYVISEADAFGAVTESNESNNTGYRSLSIAAAACSMAVTSPSSSTNWQKGSTYSITWSTSGSCGSTVNIYLYKGTSAVSTIASSTANDGSYSWTVPTGLTAGTDYRVLVVNGSGDDYSSYFTISDQACSMTVSSPSSSTNWQKGSTYSITWSTSGSCGSTVNLYLYKSTSSVATIAISTANDGSHSWTVPTGLTAGTDYRVLVVNGSGDDYSSYFTISDQACSMTVSSPSSSTDWQKGSTYSITWSTSGSCGSTVNLYLYKSTSSVATIAISTSNDGSHSWTVPTGLTAGTDYRVLVVNGSGDDYSPYFTISDQACSMTVSSPSTSTNWQKGSTYTITWSTSGSCGSTVNLYLYRGTGIAQTIVLSTANDGGYSWTVPTSLSNGSDYRVLLVNGSGDDYSSYFTVSDPTTESTLFLVEGSVAGQNLYAGSQRVYVDPGEAIVGSIAVSINSQFPSNAVMAMGITPSWGNHSTSYTDLGGFSTPTSDLRKTISVAYTAPLIPGTYHITVAYRGEFDAGDVMSCTNWSYGSNVWNNGDDIADWTIAQVEDAILNGYRLADYLPSPQKVPATSLIVVVGAPVQVDFDQDGNSDLVWRNLSSGQNAVWSMNGATQLASILIAALANLDWELKGAGDFNGDQKPDLVWRNNKDGRNAVWYMDGFNLTGTEYLEPLALQWQLAAINDFNGDGQSDLIWRNPSDGRNAIWTMNGATRLDAYYLKPIHDVTWSLVASGDFDGDGDADLAWRNTSDGRNAIWFMNGTTRVGSQYFREVNDLNWIIGGAADYDADGKADLVWRNASDGRNAIWFMDGTTRVSSSYTKSVADQSWQIGAPR